MFSDTWKSADDPIEIRDMDASPVISLLRWIYCSELVFESDRLLDLLHVAHMNMVTPVIQHVMDNFGEFAKDYIWPMFEFAILHDNRDLGKKCIQLMEHKSKAETGKAIMQPEFLHLSVQTITSLVSVDSLHVDERLLFSRCLEWAKAECTIKKEKADRYKLRSLMQPFNKTNMHK